MTLKENVELKIYIFVKENSFRPLWVLTNTRSLQLIIFTKKQRERNRQRRIFFFFRKKKIRPLHGCKTTNLDNATLQNISSAHSNDRNIASCPESSYDGAPGCPHHRWRCMVTMATKETILQNSLFKGRTIVIWCS